MIIQRDPRKRKYLECLIDGTKHRFDLADSDLPGDNKLGFRYIGRGLRCTLFTVNGVRRMYDDTYDFYMKA